MKNYKCCSCGWRTTAGGLVPNTDDVTGLKVCPTCHGILTPKIGPIPGRRKPAADRSRPVTVYLSQPFADWLENRPNRKSDVENALQIVYNLLPSARKLTMDEEKEEAFRR